ncbi:hypothetical protein BV22DRAFT_524951 [Leucogyrophana mollusca]|uniref:Uncharacterized protein n=1 Tax=Leucogyrophana mollusca TaxID=85980 RepID=A0ACB8BES7_9AGAM|nr:hypothetical protein BV22DRAFT_524951 [Leucogyrophana mollusca]
MCTAPTVVTEFLECMHIAPRKVEISLSSVPTGEMPGLFIALAQHCDRCSLQHIKIWNEVVDVDNEPVIALQHVQPLFCFAALRILDLILFRSFSLDDHALSEMAMSWPILERLRLLAEPLGHRHAPSNITFRGIVTLVERCPRLEYLHIEIDATDLASSSPQELRRVTPNRALRSLGVGDSLLDNPEEVALRLFDLFPKLDRIATRSALSEEGHLIERRQELWKQVEGHLKLFRMVREQTRWRDRHTT